ncbi:MAG: nitrous oxide-stimulated promoter family protein [Desulfuromusa sp.]|nr:nitrous oxide-stimulated promoter family protein [Desulfuromusa sp.]
MLPACSIWRRVTRRPEIIHQSRDQSNPPLTRKEKKDLKILALFTSVYCRDHHTAEIKSLSDLPEQLASLERYACCAPCREFLLYAIERRLNCPLEERPVCKHCQVHCYRPDYREKVRDIMRYSGKTLIKRGRLDLLWHYLF